MSEGGPAARGEAQWTPPWRRAAAAFALFATALLAGDEAITRASAQQAGPSTSAQQETAEIGDGQAFLVDRAKTAAMTAVDAAAAEQAPFLVCSATEPETNEFMRRSWDGQLRDLARELARAGVEPAWIAVFYTYGFSKFQVPNDWSFNEAIAYCQSHGDWSRRYRTLDFTFLIDRFHREM